MTNQQGAPEALTDFEHRHAIRQGYEIAASDRYFEARQQIDSNDRRKVFQAGFERGWDRLAALVEAQQPATHVQNPAEIEHVADDVSKNGAETNMAQQPAPSAASKAVLAAIRAANMQLVRTGDDEFMLVTYKNAKAQCDGGKCGIGGYCDDCPTPQADSQPAPEYVGNGMFKGETIEKAAEHWANWCDVRCMTGLSEFLRVVAARVQAASVLEDAARLDFIERHPEMSLRHRKGKWAFLGFTNYEYEMLPSLRASVDATRKQGGVDADCTARTQADSVLEDADPIRALIAEHAAILDQNESAYFELCYHREAGWMAWITDKPLCMPPVVNPDRKVLAQGQADTADEACRDAARKQGGKP